MLVAPVGSRGFPRDPRPIGTNIDVYGHMEDGVRAAACWRTAEASKGAQAAALVSLLCALALAGPAMAQPRNGAGPPASAVAVDAVVLEPLAQTVPVIGRLVARQSGVVAARVGGAVDQMSVDVGDRVERGDVIAVVFKNRLEIERDRTAAVVTQRRAVLETAQAELQKASQELRRLEDLRDSAAFSRARLDDVTQDVAMQAGELAEAQAQLGEAQARLSRAATDLTDAEIVAPFAGVITEKHTEAGAYLNIGSPVVTLLNDTDLEVEVEVPSNRLVGLEVGNVLTFTLDDGSMHSGIVRAIVPNENPLTRARPVRITPLFDASAPRAANQSATVAIPVGLAREVVTVHKDAIVRRGREPMVFVVDDDGKAQPRPVSLGEGIGSRFVVRRGLVPGELVVVRGNEQLRPGQAVRLVGG